MAKDFKSFFWYTKLDCKRTMEKEKPTQKAHMYVTALLFVTMVIETDVISIVTKHYLSPCEIEDTMFLTKP